MKKGFTLFTSLLIAISTIPNNNIVDFNTMVSATSIEKENSIPDGYTAVYTIEDLYAIRNNLEGKYILMNDIDLSETAPGGEWDNGNGWLPIKNFAGIFDGNGYAIKNMNIYGNLKAGNYGLFGSLKKDNYSNPKVLRLAIVDCNIDCNISSNALGSFYIGAIAGTCDSRTIEKCYTSGKIKIKCKKNYCYIGGISGRGNQISNSFNTMEIEVTTDNISTISPLCVGGIVGAGSVNNVYNIGNIICDNTRCDVGNIGGLLETDSDSKNYYYLKTLNEYNAFGFVRGSSNTGLTSSKLTYAQMKSKSTFINFDFDNIWAINPNDNYPFPTLQEVACNLKINTDQSDLQPSESFEQRIQNLENQVKTLSEENQKLKSRNIFDINLDGQINVLDLVALKSYLLSL